MDASAKAIAAYGYAQKGATTERGVEYQVFARVTAAISAADRKGKEGFIELVGALHDNSRLWDAITVDLIDDNNELDPELRGRLLKLAAFMRHHTNKVLRNKAEAQPIVDVNRAIMNGLRGILPQPTEVDLGKS